MTFTEFVQPIKLGTGHIDRFTPVTISGWGKIDNDTYSNKLNYAELLTISNAECKKSFEHHIYDSVLCTAPPDGSCQGDEGGPLVFRKKLVGILSHVQPCGSDKPGLYTRVADFAEWIEYYIYSEVEDEYRTGIDCEETTVPTLK